MIALLIALGFPSIYNVPASIAIHRQMQDRRMLTAVNLFFGWTVLGWFACLLWAALGTRENALVSPA